MVGHIRVVAFSVAPFLLFSSTNISARSTDQQANEAYNLMSAGCVMNKIPFFTDTPDALRRTETPEGTIEERQYGMSHIRTLLTQGKTIVEEITVSMRSTPAELSAVFALPIQRFFLRYGVGRKIQSWTYRYGDGLAELTARFDKKQLVDLKWSCGYD